MKGSRSRMRGDVKMAVVKVCDKCGIAVKEPLKKTSSFLGFEINTYKYNTFYRVYFSDAEEDVILCASCGKKMHEWLNTPKKKD